MNYSECQISPMLKFLYSLLWPDKSSTKLIAFLERKDHSREFITKVRVYSALLAKYWDKGGTGVWSGGRTEYMSHEQRMLLHDLGMGKAPELTKAQASDLISCLIKPYDETEIRGNIELAQYLEWDQLPEAGIAFRVAEADLIESLTEWFRYRHTVECRQEVSQWKINENEAFNLRFFGCEGFTGAYQDYVVLIDEQLKKSSSEKQSWFYDIHHKKDEICDLYRFKYSSKQCRNKWYFDAVELIYNRLKVPGFPEDGVVIDCIAMMRGRGLTLEDIVERYAIRT